MELGSAAVDSVESKLMPASTVGEQPEPLAVDMDCSKPQYIPRDGAFYEHDMRTSVEDGEEEDTKKKEEGSKKSKAPDRWSHDCYVEADQSPKSSQDMVDQYGYDIRALKEAPEAGRKYGRGPDKYDRKWSDMGAYLVKKKVWRGSEMPRQGHEHPLFPNRDPEGRRVRSEAPQNFRTTWRNPVVNQHRHDYGRQGPSQARPSLDNSYWNRNASWPVMDDHIQPFRTYANMESAQGTLEEPQSMNLHPFTQQQQATHIISSIPLLNPQQQQGLITQGFNVMPWYPEPYNVLYQNLAQFPSFIGNEPHFIPQGYPAYPQEEGSAAADLIQSELTPTFPDEEMEYEVTPGEEEPPDNNLERKLQRLDWRRSEIRNRNYAPEEIEVLPGDGENAIEHMATQIMPHNTHLNLQQQQQEFVAQSVNVMSRFPVSYDGNPRYMPPLFIPHVAGMEMAHANIAQLPSFIGNEPHFVPGYPAYPQAQMTELYQTPGGATYYSPNLHTGSAQARPLQTRRRSAAIPIVSPPEDQ